MALIQIICQPTKAELHELKYENVLKNLQNYTLEF